MIAGAEAGVTLIPLGVSAGFWNFRGGEVPAVRNGSVRTASKGLGVMIRAVVGTSDTSGKATAESFCFMAGLAAAPAYACAYRSGLLP